MSHSTHNSTNMNFIETLCMHNGAVLNAHAHVLRMLQTAQYFGFAAPALPHLQAIVPHNLLNEKVKCRIVYRATIEDITFEKYTPRIVSSLKLVEKSDLKYAFKFADRASLSALSACKTPCDEILITQNGYITDTSYSNVVFRKNGQLFTPDTYLLNGTRRQQLLNRGQISEQRITIENLHQFECVYLINAMLGVEEAVAIPIDKILR